MHRDTKIGFALGILLLGTIAAFCFRNRPLSDTNRFALVDPNSVNSVLEQRAIKPYLPKANLSADPAHDAYSLTDHFNARAYPTQKEIAYKGEQLPPNPITEKKLEAIAAQPAKQVTAKQTTTKLLPVLVSKVKADSATTSPAVSSTEPLVHVVQPGDTLSGLASRYLGSVVKAQELFEANRHVLTSPDRLQLGMKLTIPMNTQEELPPKIADGSHDKTR